MDVLSDAIMRGIGEKLSNRMKLNNAGGHVWECYRHGNPVIDEFLSVTCAVCNEKFYLVRGGLGKLDPDPTDNPCRGYVLPD